MELREFHGRIYGKYLKQLFVFESIWDSFRPITSVGWNGHTFEVVDRQYKQEFLGKFYGYGSPEMKEVCRRLTETIELGDAPVITDPVVFWKWLGVCDAKWWNDRPCVFASRCVDRSKTSWKTYLSFLQTKPKTLRNSIVRMLTRKRRLV
jgi:hypothetical protein